MNNLKSLNTSDITFDKNVIIIETPMKSDYFNSPVLKDNEISITNTAPFYYKDIDGDFTITVSVKNNFKKDYDAGAIFVYESDYKWIKLAYEKTDFNTHAIVTVITDKTSDDANGPNVEGEWLHLMASRKGDVFVLHYSLDKRNYIMARLFRMKANRTLKVGLTAQSPIGDKTKRIFKDLVISDYRLKNLRMGTLK